ncbi:MAG: hypothetical protein LBJ07_04855, partial [Actinomycetes bacterium]|nr:hypothetical protein [Actinomycetes bacterium]
MGGIALAIAIVFIAGIVVSARRRWEEKDFVFYPENTSRAVKSAFTFGTVSAVLLAILIGIALSGTNDSQATYIVNGAVFKGGTNWMVVVVTFIMGLGLSSLIILFVSNLPVKLLYAVSPEGRRTKKEQLKKFEELRATEVPPRLERKKSILILLTILTGGIANWFYIKLWWIGLVQILLMVARNVCSARGFTTLSFIMVFLILAVWV